MVHGSWFMVVVAASLQNIYLWRSRHLHSKFLILAELSHAIKGTARPLGLP